MTPASTRTWDRWTQALVPCTPAKASDHTQSREHAMTQQAGPHEDPLTASSGRPSNEPGSDQPQSSHVLYGTNGVVPTRDIEVHISSPFSSMCLRAKDHLRTPGGGLPEPLRPTTRPVRQRRGLAVITEEATRKTTGDLTTRRGAGDPETRAEWVTVLRYGHLWSAQVVVDTCLRTEWEPPTLRASLSDSTRPAWAPPRWLPASSTSRQSRIF